MLIEALSLIFSDVALTFSIVALIAVFGRSPKEAPSASAAATHELAVPAWRQHYRDAYRRAGLL